MSIRTVSTYAMVRNVRPPTTADSGEAPRAPAGAATPPTAVPDEPKLMTLLTKLVPTELLAPYIALVGVVSPHITPEQSFIGIRWGAVIVLAVAAGAWTWLGYTQMAGRGSRKPVPETLGVVVAALGLTLSMPASPLYHGRDPAEATVWGVAIAGLAVVVNSFVSRAMQQPAPGA